MKVVFITPAPWLRRFPLYRAGRKLYGQSNSITEPLVLGGILKKTGHKVDVYEELNAKVHLKKLHTDIPMRTLQMLSAGRIFPPSQREADHFSSYFKAVRTVNCARRLLLQIPVRAQTGN